MPHKNRSAANANRARREAAALAQRPLSLSEQQKRAAENAAAKAARYPDPPVYAATRDRKPRAQPACYTFADDPFLAGLISIASMRRRCGRAG